MLFLQANRSPNSAIIIHYNSCICVFITQLVAVILYLVSTLCKPPHTRLTHLGCGGS